MEKRHIMAQASFPASQNLPLPDLPADAPGRPERPRYKPQFGVIAIVDDEAAQADLFQAFKLLGFKTKVVST